MNLQTKSPDIPIHSMEEMSLYGSTDFEIAKYTGLNPDQMKLCYLPHRNDFYMFAFVRTGTARHWLDMIMYNLKPDTLYFSAPHHVINKEGGTFNSTCIMFTHEFLAMENGLTELPIIQNLHDGHELKLSAADMVFIEDISAKMMEEQARKENWGTSMLLSYLRVLLIYLSRLYTAQFTVTINPSDRGLMKRFLMLIDENYVQWHDVANYAEAVNLSAGHFGELIRKQSGRTPIELIHDRLLLEAKRALFHTEASIKEIAFQLGFDEASYFNRFFKRLNGTTPLGFRETIRKMSH